MYFINISQLFSLNKHFIPHCPLKNRFLRQVFDIFTICVICTLLCARFNCILSGCCLGKMIPGSESIRWPTRELEILFYLVLFLCLRKKVCKKKYVGQMYPIYMMAYGIFRFIGEFFRESEHDFAWFHISHLWSLIAVAVGAGIYMSISRKTKDSMKRGKRSDRAIRH